MNTLCLFICDGCLKKEFEKFGNIKFEYEELRKMQKYKFNFSFQKFDIGKFDIFLHLTKPLNKKSRKINAGVNIQ